MLDDTGQPHPAALRKPALRSDCVKYLDAFGLLSASRMWSQVGPEPIQISEVNAYLHLAGVNEPDERMKFLRLVRAMDEVELDVLMRKLKASSKGKNGT